MCMYKSKSAQSVKNNKLLPQNHFLYQGSHSFPWIKTKDFLKTFSRPNQMFLRTFMENEDML